MVMKIAKILYIQYQIAKNQLNNQSKLLDYVIRIFQKYFVVHEQSAVENSFSTYICYTPDGLFWLNLYIYIKTRLHKATINLILIQDVSFETVCKACFA